MAASRTERLGGFVLLSLVLCNLEAQVQAQTQATGREPSETQNQALSLKDLASYRAALEPSAARPLAVTFRDLWNHPERFQGVRVQVQGRLARRFRQGRFGEFPALIEHWIFSAAGDPICLVCPENQAQKAPELGDEVRFEGTFLRTIAYQGGDSRRLAPLVVGDALPRRVGPAQAKKGASSWPGNLDWTIGLAVAGIVALILVRQHLQKPPRRLPNLSDRESGPQFVDNATVTDDN